MCSLNKGVYPTMITPYKADSIDFYAVDRIVDYYAQNGCRGIFSVCLSSENTCLSLKEREQLASRVLTRRPKDMSVVASGHTAFNLRDQATELNTIGNTGVDAVVLITNRLDPYNEGDDAWIANAEKLLSMLDSHLTLGLYECPFPFKRLLTPKILNWCLKTDRFVFIKDTCKNPDVLSARLKQLKGTKIMSFNAIEQTLLYGLKQGCAGYSGVMANFHPRLLSWICENYEKEPELTDKVMNVLSMCALAENEFYPATAKYHFNLEGINMELTSRTLKNKELDSFQKYIIRQLYDVEKSITEELKL